MRRVIRYLACPCCPASGGRNMNTLPGSIVFALCISSIAGASEPPAPTPVTPERLQQLSAQLGDARFKVRQQASEELSRLGRAALPVLQDAAVNSKDPEVR